MIEAIHQVGMSNLPGVASVGLIENRPNSRNVVPGEVFFTVDLRHPGREGCSTGWRPPYQAALPRIAAETGVEVEEKRIWISPAVKFRRAPSIHRVREGAEPGRLFDARNGVGCRAMMPPISRASRPPP